MLATSTIPNKYQQWNADHGAPCGRQMRLPGWKKFFLSSEKFQERLGPFAVQPNNSTRSFEYPWAFEAGQLRSGMKILEIGGGLSGFQFALAQFGCTVVNVDPGLKAHGIGWPCDEKKMVELNQRFKTNVELRNTTIEKSNLPDDEFDRAYSISVLEHLSSDEIPFVMGNVFRCLKPGGLFILTVDLFLNIYPFSSRPDNEYGVNRNICELIQFQPWILITGKMNELFGFPEFDKDKVLSRLENFMLGHHYPALAQCLVLKKPAVS